MNVLAARDVATELRHVTADAGLIVMPTDTPASLPAPDLVVIPGSSRPFGPLADRALLDWVRQAARSATWLASVCTGAGSPEKAGPDLVAATLAQFAGGVDPADLDPAMRERLVTS